MPYSGANDPDLPSNVKKLPAKKREAWVARWNAVYAKCKKQGGKDCEGKAFRIANGTIEEAINIVPENNTSNPLFVDLSGYLGKKFDGLVSGVFTDLWGREIEIKEADLSVIVENTKDAIEHTRGEDNVVVGLPIDTHDHENGNAAGWIINVELEDNRIRFTPSWTDVGLDLIQRGLQKFFSATLQLKDKVILGGSLTNWPATRSKDGRVLLRPIELSNPPHAGIYQLEQQDNLAEPEISDDGDDEMANEELINDVVAAVRASLQEDIRSAVSELATPQTQQEPQPQDPVAQMSGFEELIAGLDLDDQKTELIDGVKAAMLAQYENVQEQARVEVARMLANVKRESNTANFCAQVVGGTPEVPQGLPVDEDELKAWMLSLNPVQAQKAQNFLTQIWQNGLVGFNEIGHNNETERATLPVEIVQALNEGKLTVADLSNETLNLGDVSRYDLSKWA